MFLLKIAITLIVLFIAFSFIKNSINKKRQNKDATAVDEPKDEHENLGV